MKNLISISGSAGHGKDTVGKIIQWLLSGNAEGQFIEQVCATNNNEWWLEEKSGFEIKKFAGKLKQIASLLTGIPVEKFEDQEFKKLDMNPEWGMTYREFLQRLGTEAMRDGLHTNVWVNALFADYKGLNYKEWNDGQFNPYPIKREYTEDLQFPNWIITDMRFPNEMDAVKEREGITIRVVRPCIECGGIGYHKMSCSKQYQKEHPSETSLDTAEFDYKIINDGSIEDLVEKVREVLIKEGFLV